MSYRATSLYTDWVEAWSRSFPASTRRWPSETRRMPATPSRPVIPSHQPPEAASTPVSVHCLHPRNYTPVVFMDQDGRRLLFWHCSVHTRVITRYTYMHTKRFMIHTHIHTHIHHKKLSYRRGTARCVVSVEILPIATQQCRNYLYDKSRTNRSYKVGGLKWADV